MILIVVLILMMIVMMIIITIIITIIIIIHSNTNIKINTTIIITGFFILTAIMIICGVVVFLVSVIVTFIVMLVPLYHHRQHCHSSQQRVHFSILSGDLVYPWCSCRPHRCAADTCRSALFCCDDNFVGVRTQKRIIACLLRMPQDVGGLLPLLVATIPTRLSKRLAPPPPYTYDAQCINLSCRP